MNRIWFSGEARPDNLLLPTPRSSWLQPEVHLTALQTLVIAAHSRCVIAAHIWKVQQLYVEDLSVWQLSVQHPSQVQMDGLTEI